MTPHPPLRLTNTSSNGSSHAQNMQTTYRYGTYLHIEPDFSNGFGATAHALHCRCDIYMGNGIAPTYLPSTLSGSDSSSGIDIFVSSRERLPRHRPGEMRKKLRHAKLTGVAHGTREHRPLYQGVDKLGQRRRGSGYCGRGVRYLACPRFGRLGDRATFDWCGDEEEVEGFLGKAVSEVIALDGKLRLMEMV